MTDNTTLDLPARAEEGPGKEERAWAMLTHLSALAGLLSGIGFIIGPLVVWLLKRDTMPFVDDQGKEALNFQVTMALVFCVCWALMFVLIGFLLIPLLALLDVILVVIATVKAHEGVRYRYPFALRLIS